MKENELVRCEYNNTVTYVPNDIFAQVVFRAQYPEKRFIGYHDGPAVYSIGETKFRQLAKEAGAVKHLNGRAIVDMEILDKYIEDFY